MTSAAVILAAVVGAAVLCGLAYLIAATWTAAPILNALPRGVLAARCAQYVAVIAVGIGASVLVTTAFGHVVQAHAVTRPDRAVYRDVVTNRTAWLTHLSSHLTGAGNQWAQLVVAVVLGLALALWLQAPRVLVVLGLCILVEIELQKQMGHLVHSVKPAVATSIGDPGGYPSGGVTRVLLTFGIAAVFVGARGPVKQRQWLIAGATGLACIEAFSRLYLGRHWPVDILGAFVLGGCLLATVAAAETVRGRPVPKPSLG